MREEDVWGVREAEEEECRQGIERVGCLVGEIDRSLPHLGLYYLL